MPKTKKGFIYGGSESGGGSSSNQNASDVQATSPTIPVLDEDGSPILDTDGNPLTNPNPAYDPNAPFQGTPHKFLGLIPYTAGKNLANQLNLGIQSQVAQQKALQPGSLSTFGGEQSILTQQQKQRLQNELGIKQQGEQYDLSQQGNAIANLAKAGNIPYSSIPGTGGSYPDIANAFKMFYGNLGNAGIGAAPSMMQSTIASNQANTQSSLNRQNEALGQSPYMNKLGQQEGLYSTLEPAEKFRGMQLDNIGREFHPGNQFRIGLSGNPEFYKAPGEDINTQFITIKGSDGRPMQVPTSQTKVATPANIKTIQPPVDPDSVAAANKEAMENESINESERQNALSQPQSQMQQSTIPQQHFGARGPDIDYLLKLLIKAGGKMHGNPPKN